MAALTVGDIMRPGVVTCSPQASIGAMAGVMVAHGIHAVVITPSGNHDPLVVSDLELLAGALRDNALTAAGLAREPIAAVSTGATLAHAVEMMSTRSASHLLAVSPDTGHSAGMVSTLDVAAVAAGVRPRLARMARPAPARPSASARDLDRARVGDVMHSGITACDPSVPVATVAKVMADHRTHCAAVSGIDGTPGREQRLTWGLIDDMDLIGAVHRGALDAPAATIVDTAPLAVLDSDSLARVARLMIEHERRHLVVVGRSGLPSGIVSTLDVAHVLANR